MLGQISSKQFAEWMAFYSIEPWGLQRDNLLAAMTPLMLAQVYRKKGSRRPKLKDWILWPEVREKLEQSDDEVVAGVLSFFGQMGLEMPDWAKARMEAADGDDS